MAPRPRPASATSAKRRATRRRIVAATTPDPASSAAAAERRARAKKRRRRQAKVIVQLRTQYPLVREAIKARGWVIARKNEAWDLAWSDSDDCVARSGRLNRMQVLNHFPASSEICRKDFLAFHLNAMRRRFPDAYSFAPATFILPGQAAELTAEIARTSRRRHPRVYIAKPNSRSQGKGILLLQRPSDLARLSQGGRYVVQKYVSRPLLLEGKKFDLRVYVLLRSVDPLEVYVFRDGLVRLCTVNYKAPRRANLRKTKMHLTNFAINKHGGDFEHTADPGSGSKRAISACAEFLDPDGTLWERIEDLVVKVLLSAHGAVRAAYTSYFGTAAEPPSSGRLSSRRRTDSACFELLGFDVMLDAKRKLWMIECNHAPSFSGGSAVDDTIKRAVLSGALELIGLTEAKKRRYLRDVKRDWAKRLWGQPRRRRSRSRSAPSAPEALGTPRGAVAEPPPPPPGPRDNKEATTGGRCRQRILDALRIDAECENNAAADDEGVSNDAAEEVEAEAGEEGEGGVVHNEAASAAEKEAGDAHDVEADAEGGEAPSSEPSEERAALPAGWVQIYPPPSESKRAYLEAFAHGAAHRGNLPWLRPLEVRAPDAEDDEE